MKTLLSKILISTLITMSLSAAATTTPKSCQEVLELSVTEGPYANEVEEAIAAAVRDSKKVIELKLQAHNYGMTYPKIYGNYLRQVQIKADIDLRISEAYAEKKKYFEQSDALLLSLVNAESESYRHILWERAKATKKFNKIIDKAEADWRRNQKAYYNAVAEWAPYGYQLQGLEKLEASLLVSLENLRSIIQVSNSSFEELLKHLKQWSPSSTGENCSRVSETLSAIIEEDR